MDGPALLKRKIERSAQGNPLLEASALHSGSIGARLYGVGLGPGDPDLVTVKAARLLGEASIVAYFAKQGSTGHARTIAARWLRQCEEIPLHYPVTTEIAFSEHRYADALQRFYDESEALLSALLHGGNEIVLICEGDPLFYGSFMHLYVRLRARFPVTIVPGVTGMSACWTTAGSPMVWGDDILTVLPATLSGDILASRLLQTDAAAIMKIGKNLRKVRDAVEAAGLSERALYVERASMGEEQVLPLKSKRNDDAPYFSIVLIPSKGQRR